MSSIQALDRAAPAEAPAAERQAGETSTAGTPAGVTEGCAAAGLVAGARERVRRLAADPLSGAVDDEALAASVQALHRLESMVHAEKLRRIAALDQRQAWRGKAMSAADWLGPTLGLDRADAKRHTDAAGALQRLPATAGKLAAGELGVGHARQAARRLGELDRLADAGVTLAPDAAATLDQHVAGEGPGSTPGQLRRRARPPHQRHRPRTPGQRVADAYTTLAQAFLDRGEGPEVAAQRPHVLLITTADALRGWRAPSPR